eukprot:997294_1
MRSLLFVLLVNLMMFTINAQKNRSARHVKCSGLHVDHGVRHLKARFGDVLDFSETLQLGDPVKSICSYTFSKNLVQLSLKIVRQSHSEADQIPHSFPMMLVCSNDNCGYETFVDKKRYLMRRFGHLLDYSSCAGTDDCFMTPSIEHGSCESRGLKTGITRAHMCADRTSPPNSHPPSVRAFNTINLECYRGTHRAPARYYITYQLNNVFNGRLMCNKVKVECQEEYDCATELLPDFLDDVASQYNSTIEVGECTSPGDCRLSLKCSVNNPVFDDRIIDKDTVTILLLCYESSGYALWLQYQGRFYAVTNQMHCAA